MAGCCCNPVFSARSFSARTICTAGTQAPVPVPMLGHVPSSYWSENCGHSIALALVAGGHERMGETLYVPMPDGVIEVEVTSTVFFDEKGERTNG